jgi:hypothetical protein
MLMAHVPPFERAPWPLNHAPVSVARDGPEAVHQYPERRLPAALSSA